MKGLEDAGYLIEAKSRVGYRIIRTPNSLSEYTIKWGLDTNWLGKTIIHKKTTVSTQSDAHQLAHERADHGTVIIANEQTGGKGRQERNWHSSKNQGIWMSIILKPSILPYEAPQLTLLTATVLADVMSEITNLQPQIKWPNDVLINNKKVAGILTEMQAEQDHIRYVVIGMGINVNQEKKDFPKNIEEKASSLRIEADKEWPIQQIVQHILEAFEEQYQKYIENGFPNVKNKWESYGYRIGELIEVITSNEKWEATFLGIAEDGALLLKLKSGEIKRIDRKSTRLNSSHVAISYA